MFLKRRIINLLSKRHKSDCNGEDDFHIIHPSWRETIAKDNKRKDGWLVRKCGNIYHYATLNNVSKLQSMPTSYYYAQYVT